MLSTGRVGNQLAQPESPLDRSLHHVRMLHPRLGDRGHFTPEHAPTDRESIRIGSVLRVPVAHLRPPDSEESPESRHECQACEDQQLHEGWSRSEDGDHQRREPERCCERTHPDQGGEAGDGHRGRVELVLDTVRSALWGRHRGVVAAARSGKSGL